MSINKEKTTDEANTRGHWKHTDKRQKKFQLTNFKDQSQIKEYNDE